MHMASFEETRECSIEEYEQGKDQRFTPDQIFTGEDYTVMAKGNYDSDELEAIAVPARCIELPKAYKTPGIWVVKLAGLDQEMRPVEEDLVYLRQDGMLELTPEFREHDPEVSEGYLKAYGNGLVIDWDLFFESSGRH